MLDFNRMLTLSIIDHNEWNSAKLIGGENVTNRTKVCSENRNQFRKCADAWLACSKQNLIVFSVWAKKANDEQVGGHSSDNARSTLFQRSNVSQRLVWTGFFSMLNILLTFLNILTLLPCVPLIDSTLIQSDLTSLFLFLSLSLSLAFVVTQIPID